MLVYRVITGDLKARTAVHIGTGVGDGITDALVRRDSEGLPFVPGTAIAGALRSLLTRLAPRLGLRPCLALDLDSEKRSCGCEVCALLGDINPSDENATACVSRLFVFNATLSKESEHSVSVRDGVGIDREASTSAKLTGAKFDAEVVSPGATFKMRLEIEDPTGTDELLLAVGLAEWKEGRVWLGGGVARGLGAFELCNLEFKSRGLHEIEDLMAFLQSDEPWKDAVPKENWLGERLQQVSPVPCVAKTPSNVSRGWVRFTGILRIDGPFLINDIMRATMSGFDHAPTFHAAYPWTTPTLHGSSLRGVIRSHAERIARTVASMNALNSDPSDPASHFLRCCPACDPNRRTDNESSEGLALESCDSLLGRDKRTEDSSQGLCLGCQLFGSTRQGSRLIVEDAPCLDAKPKYKMLDFLAIDRFTGGGAAGAKFDALALWNPSFKLNIYLENPEDWEIGWLCLVLRDLVEGWLAVGLGSSKGFGRAQVDDLRISFGYLTRQDFAFLPSRKDDQIQSGVYKVWETAYGGPELHEVVGRCLTAFGEKVKGFSRSPATVLGKDTYFERADSLYPMGGRWQ